VVLYKSITHPASKRERENQVPLADEGAAPLVAVGITG